MNKIDIKDLKVLKSWPFKEAQQIITINGGLENFKIPQKGHILFEYSVFLIGCLKKSPNLFIMIYSNG